MCWRLPTLRAPRCQAYFHGLSPVPALFMPNGCHGKPPDHMSSIEGGNLCLHRASEAVPATAPLDALRGSRIPRQASTCPVMLPLSCWREKRPDSNDRRRPRRFCRAAPAEPQTRHIWRRRHLRRSGSYAFRHHVDGL